MLLLNQLNRITAKPIIEAPMAKAAALLAFAKQYPAALKEFFQIK